MRVTQRAPRSCISCYSRKVKCDKTVPCGTCVRRGLSEECSREIVVVRGELMSSPDFPKEPTYEQLKSENEQLRRELERAEPQRIGATRSSSVPDQVHTKILQAPSRPPRTQWYDEDEDGLEQKLWDSLTHSRPVIKTAVSSWGEIILPSPTCLENLIDYDEKWNSWVHYALEYPQFRQECDEFVAAITSRVALERAEPSWLAVFFSVLSAALLMMDDDVAEMSTVDEQYEHRVLSEMWYNAAIFCLHRADFMRTPSLRSVQAIAILGICFNNFGDSEMGQHFWNSALRIAQRIGLDTPFSELAGRHLSKEAQHRLWWTLVICEWLCHPYHPPAVDDIDFDVPYPQAQSQVAPAHSPKDPVHYHIFMARSATAYYRFRRAVKSRSATVEHVVQAVRAADEELASIIDTLPSHLQPDFDDGNGLEQSRHPVPSEPWLVWQRFDLTVVLLHLRVRVNRTLQDQWLFGATRNRLDWARAISVRSSVSIIWINRNWAQPASMRKQWALSFHIFTSAILLLREHQSSTASPDQKHREAIHAAIELLDRVKARSVLAQQASLIIQERARSHGLA